MRFRLRTLLIAMAVLGVLFGYWRYYVVGSTYFWGRNMSPSVRVYDTAWKATLFKPAAKLESIATGHPVYTAVWTNKASLQFRWP